MANITDIIEQHIKQILDECESGTLEIQRSELAKLFQCVPSQINYVMSTRFTAERGYRVESKRGGGGYIRIQKIEWACSKTWYDGLMHLIGSNITQASADGIVDQLVDQEVVTDREARLLRTVVSREVLQLPMPLRDQLRANILRALITSLMIREKGE